MGTIVIGFRHKHFCGAAQVAIVGRGWISKFLRGIDAMLFQHYHKHLGVHNRTGVEEFHEANLGRRCSTRKLLNLHSVTFTEGGILELIPELLLEAKIGNPFVGDTTFPPGIRIGGH